MQHHPQALTGPGETTVLSTTDLRLFEGNARQGDVGAISESLQRLGQYRAIVVNRGTLTGRPNEVLAGNHTLKAAIALGWESITAHVIDVDEDTARRIVLVDNRTNDLATNDNNALLALLHSLDGDYSGSGYDGDAVDEVLAAVEASLNEDYGEPEDDDDRAPTTGELLALTDVTFAEPTAQPAHGTKWRLGPHLLVIANLSTEHPAWSPHLPGRVFAPYPDPYLPQSTLARESALLLVQPNRFLAGHLIDKWNAVHPDDQAAQQ